MQIEKIYEFEIKFKNVLFEQTWLFHTTSEERALSSIKKILDRENKEYKIISVVNKGEVG